MTGFVEVYNRLKTHEKEVLGPIPAQLKALLTSVQRSNPELAAVNQEIAQLSQQIHGIRRLQTMGVLSADLGIEKLRVTQENLDRIQEKRKRLQQNDALEQQAQEVQNTIERIYSSPQQITAFDEEVFEGLVEKVLVKGNGTLRFCLYGGMELEKERT